MITVTLTTNQARKYLDTLIRIIKYCLLAIIFLSLTIWFEYYSPCSWYSLDSWTRIPRHCIVSIKSS